MTSKQPYNPITTAATTTTPPPQLPTSTPLSSNLDYISRAKHRIYSTLATRRPWRQLLNHHALAFPTSISDSFSRLKTNLSYFRVNFAMLILFFLFCSLIWSPVSLIVFVLCMIGWLFLFFLRDAPLVLFGREIDDRIVLAVLSIATVALLLLTGSTGNILISVAVGFVVVAVFSVFRKTDDLFLDEEEAAGAGLLAGRTAGPGLYPPR